MSRTCTVSLFQGPGNGFTSNNFDLEPAARGEVLVAVTACALCRSDLHTIAGRRPCHTPAVLGHEIVGKVVETGGPVNDWNGRLLQPSDRVTWTIAASCHDCFYCRNDLPQKCEQLVKYGHSEMGPSGPLGGLSTHCRLLPGTSIFTIPAPLTDQQVVPANCCTATSVAAVRRAGPIRNATVLVMGAGSLGVTVAEYSLREGAEAVVLVDIDSERLKAAESIAGVTVYHNNPPVDAMPEPLSQLTNGRGADIAIDVSGATSAVSSALDWLRTGGRAVLVGSVFHSPPLELDTESVVRKMLTITGLHNYRPEDLAEALEFLSELPDSARSLSLAGTAFPLSDIDNAVAAADSNEHLRVVVTPST